MIKLDQIQNIIDISKLLQKELLQYNKALEKWNNQYDLAQKAVNIEKLSHRLHCACVRWWIADAEITRYWEKVRHNWRNETLVLFETPWQ